MQLGELNRYGISERMIEVWRHRQGESLLPVQRRAIRQGLLDPTPEGGRRPNSIIAAPTSAGKSFCGELACARALAAQQRVVMVFPLKSLVEQKYSLFRRTYEPLGLKCLILTSDHPENDRRFLAGDYHIALTIQEKFDLALAGRLDLLRNIGLVVIDELQTISEPGRGAVLERLLTRILASTYRPEIVGLSAVLVDQCLDPLAAWLNATVIEESVRPRELIRGVVADGRLTYRTYNDGRDGSEEIDSACAVGDPEQMAVWLAGRIKADSGRTLIFLKSRADTVQLALTTGGRARTSRSGRGAEASSRRGTVVFAPLAHAGARPWDRLPQLRSVFASADRGRRSVLLRRSVGSLRHDHAGAGRESSGRHGLSRDGQVRVGRIPEPPRTGPDQPGRIRQHVRPRRDGSALAPTPRGGPSFWPSRRLIPTFSGTPTSPPADRGRIQSAWESLSVDDWVLHMIVCGLARTSGDLDNGLRAHAACPASSGVVERSHRRCRFRRVGAAAG